MPTPEDYIKAAHAMAHGRAHRLREGEIVFEEAQGPGGEEEVGAWIPIDLWISAQECERVLEDLRMIGLRKAFEQKHPEEYPPNA